jgi:hypothetical protein
MNENTLDRASRKRTMWAGVALLFVVTIGGVILRRAAGPDAMLALAYVYGAGTIAMAWLMARTTRYPRWAWFTIAAVMALALVASVARQEPRWAKEWQSLAWMFPWWFLLFSSGDTGAKRGWCAPAGRWAGAILVGSGLLFTFLALGLPLLMRR